MHSKASKWDSEEILNTKQLQLFALDEFMSALKYSRTTWANSHVTYESGDYKNKGREVLSFRKCVELYNGNSMKCIFGRPPSKLTLWSWDDYTVAKAKAARPLRSLKLQFCKNTHQIIVQDHRIQFTLESYSKIFLNDKHLG